MRLGRKYNAPKTVDLNLARAWEAKPPKGQEPVQWLLLTTEPVTTATDLKRVVDIYRTRWMVEEYFKALKSGCSMENDALQIALAVFLPIAWRLLLMRTVARTSPKAKATTILNPIQFGVIEHKTGKSTKAMTAEEALYAVARLGGHLRRNGPPGCQTVGRGYQELLLVEAGFRAAIAMAAKTDALVINE